MSEKNILNSEFSSPDIELRGLLFMLWRRRYVFAAFLFAGQALGFMTLGVLKPQYTARSIILLEVDRAPNPVDKISQALSGAKLDSSLVLNELEILRSSTMARALVQRLALMADPEFNPRFKDLQGHESSANDQKFRNLSLYGSELKTLPPEVFDIDLADVAQRVMDNLRIRSINGSFAIQVDFTSVEPAKAALISNKIADLYIEQRLERNFNSARKMTEFLDSRLNDLRTQLRVAEIKVEQYRADQNLFEAAGSSKLSAAQITQLNQELITAKTDRARAEAKLDQIVKLNGDYDRIDGLSDGDTSLIDSLKRDEAELEAEISQLSSRYGEKHPQMINRRLKIAEIRRALGQEIDHLESATQAEIHFADARVKALEQELFSIENNIHQDNAAMIRLRELEREAEVARLVFDRFLESYKRAGEQEKLQDAEARIISYATVPRFPSFPDKKLVMALSLLISTLFGFIAVLVSEKFDNSYRNSADLEQDLGYSCYGLIPAAKTSQRPALGRYVLDHPASNVAEAVRTLRMVLNLRAGKKQKVITLTSSFSGEGKTTLSLWLARLAAKSGDRVIILDVDLRNPNLHVALGLNNESSLVDYLSGDQTLDDIIHEDESGAHMVFGRSVPDMALDLVGSDMLQTLIGALRESYDLVIIDTPACLAVSDARLLATLSDHMLYAVAWNKTRRESVATGIRQFADIGLKSVAFVLTNVNIRKHMKYGYGDIAVYQNIKN